MDSETASTDEVPAPIVCRPVAVVVGGREDVIDDNWGTVRSIIRFDTSYEPESVAGLNEFSHIEVLFHFDQVAETAIESGARHPRGRTDWPLVGIFAQRGKNRPNRLGISRAKVLHVEGRDVHVQGLDAVSGSPVLDVKPVMREFEVREPIRQPDWATELMRDYY